LNETELYQRIAEAAYYRAERRSFAGNSALDDWLEAEREVSALDSVDAAGSEAAPSKATAMHGATVQAPPNNEMEIPVAQARESAEEMNRARAPASAQAATTATGSAKEKGKASDGLRRAMPLAR
jgi:hypothetical protein